MFLTMHHMVENTRTHNPTACGPYPECGGIISKSLQKFVDAVSPYKQQMLGVDIALLNANCQYYFCVVISNLFHEVT